MESYRMSPRHQLWIPSLFNRLPILDSQLVPTLGPCPEVNYFILVIQPVSSSFSKTYNINVSTIPFSSKVSSSSVFPSTDLWRPKNGGQHLDWPFNDEWKMWVDSVTGVLREDLKGGEGWVHLSKRQTKRSQDGEPILELTSTNENKYEDSRIGTTSHLTPCESYDKSLSTRFFESSPLRTGKRVPVQSPLLSRVHT